MERRFKKRENETLHDWCHRLAGELKMTQKQRDVLCEVSKESWIGGVKTEREISKKYEH